MKKVMLLLTAVLFSLCFLSSGLFAGDRISFEERLIAQEAIERVYYDHRIWPADNTNPKPEFEQAVSKQLLELKVIDYLKKSYALEKVWRKPIDGPRMQAELDRIVKQSKDPGILREIFAALGNDPYVIAECLVRPILAEREIWSAFSSDTDIHAETRAVASRNIESARKNGFPKDGSDVEEIVRYFRQGYEPVSEKGADEASFRVLSSRDFERLRERCFSAGGSFMNETALAFEVVVPVKVDREFIEVKKYYTLKTSFQEWWLKTSPDMKAFASGASGNYDFKITESGPQPEAICQDNWLDSTTILEDIPDPRYGHNAVWTGTEMIVWGGGFNSGGR